MPPLAMVLGNLHVLDLAVTAAYFGLIVFLGYRKSRGLRRNQEDYFLAGRRLGKLYQLALNFGSNTDANSAVSVVSLVYRHGVSGVWLGFQLVFLNPYYWFMNAWFRRARLVTMADLFHDRLGSRGLATFYATYQAALTAFVLIGFGNFITYKISSALVTKPEAAWSASERASVEGHHELKQLQVVPPDTLSLEAKVRLEQLRDREARGELRAHVTVLEPVPFYAVFALAVGLYVIMGGMSATAANDVLQGFLIVTLSILLIPPGLAAIGGLTGLRDRVPAAMFSLVGNGNGGQPISALAVFAIFLAALVQVNGVIGNMSISGSARNEFAARFGAVTGTFAKRFMFILWSFTGLIAFALFSGADARLADPDEAWGAMSRRLLGPGLLGLMLTGVIAANMATIASQTMSVSALFVRNIYRQMRPAASEMELVRAGRWTIPATLVLGIAGASLMKSVFSVVVVLHTAVVPLGAAVLLMFLWRRLTVVGTWVGVVVSIALNIVGPFILATIPALREHPTLTVRTVDDAGRPQPVFFETVTPSDPTDPGSSYVGSDRLHLELLMLKAAGVDVEGMSPGGRFASRFFMTTGTPFVLMLLVSLCTRPPARERLDQFFGRMKTPVGATPELEEAAMAATRREPHRFDHQKLFPNSQWELTKWDRVDTVGFLLCCATSASIVGMFWTLLQLAAP